MDFREIINKYYEENLFKEKDYKDFRDESSYIKGKVVDYSVDTKVEDLEDEEYRQIYIGRETSRECVELPLQTLYDKLVYGGEIIIEYNNYNNKRVELPTIKLYLDDVLLEMTKSYYVGLYEIEAEYSVVKDKKEIFYTNEKIKKNSSIEDMNSIEEKLKLLGFGEIEVIGDYNRAKYNKFSSIFKIIRAKKTLLKDSSEYEEYDKNYKLEKSCCGSGKCLACSKKENCNECRKN